MSLADIFITRVSSIKWLWVRVYLNVITLFQNIVYKNIKAKIVPKNKNIGKALKVGGS